MKFPKVLDLIALVVNFVAAATNFYSGNHSAGIAWIAATFWCVACLFVEARARCWEDLAKRSTDALLKAHLGGRVGCVGETKMDDEGKSVFGSNYEDLHIRGGGGEVEKGTHNKGKSRWRRKS